MKVVDELLNMLHNTVIPHYGGEWLVHVDVSEAACIMRSRYFIGPCAGRIFDIGKRRQHRVEHMPIPFTAQQLEDVQDTHLLVAVPQLSIATIKHACEKHFLLPPPASWYMQEPFATRSPQQHWALIPLTPHIDIAAHSARDLAYVMIAYLLLMGDSVPFTKWRITTDRTAANQIVMVSMVGTQCTFATC